MKRVRTRQGGGKREGKRTYSAVAGQPISDVALARQASGEEGEAGEEWVNTQRGKDFEGVQGEYRD